MQTGYYNIIAAGAASGNIATNNYYYNNKIAQQGKGEVVLYKNIKLNIRSSFCFIIFIYYLFKTYTQQTIK